MADYVAPQPSRTDLRVIALRQAVDTLTGNETQNTIINRAQAFFDFLVQDRDLPRAPAPVPGEVRPKDFS